MGDSPIQPPEGHDRMLEDQMRASDDYWKAYETERKIRNLRLDAARRLSREKVHARRR